jgi:ribosomal protein S18 acetylase RimI-like enzyme
MSATESSAGCVIRAARSTDTDAIVGLLAELGYPDNEPDTVRRRLTEWAAESDSAVLVAEDDGQVRGLVAVTTIRYLEREGRLGRIVTLVVADAARNQGVGRALVDGAEKIALRNGCVAMEVSSARSRLAAHAFYRGLGYVDMCDLGARFVRDLVPGASAKNYAARFPAAGLSRSDGPGQERSDFSEGDRPRR